MAPGACSPLHLARLRAKMSSLMGKLIEAYRSASEVLFQRKKQPKKSVNHTAALFAALDSNDAEMLENGLPLSQDSLARLSNQTGLPVEEINRQIDLFMYWRQGSPRYLGGTNQR
jgi:hypothetical protein